jgi:hypothetical protein
MLPTEFESIAADVALRIRTVLVADSAGELVPDLLAATDLMSALAQRIGHAGCQTFADVRAEQALTNRRPCPTCSGRMEVLKRPSWPHETLHGPIVVQDPYTYCRACHEKDRPAHALLGTDQESWSLAVQEAVVDLASDESCGKAVAKLARHHPGVEIERTAALRELHAHGAEARAFIDEKLEAARRANLAGVVPPRPAPELEVEFDAGMIPVATYVPVPVESGKAPRLTPKRKIRVKRKNWRWEEAKVGLVQIPGQAERLYAVHPTSGLDESFADLFALAVLKGWTKTTAVRGLADGALHIRPRMERAFSEGRFKFILDRPHCKQHLTDAGALLEPSTGVPTAEWAAAALGKLEYGHAVEVVLELRNAWWASGDSDETRIDDLRVEAGYFERNQDAVAYAEYRDLGWGTASSEVESGHRHIVQVRVKISGAWWHPDRVDHILALRMLKANGWWPSTGPGSGNDGESALSASETQMPLRLDAPPDARPAATLMPGRSSTSARTTRRTALGGAAAS